MTWHRFFIFAAGLNTMSAIMSAIEGHAWPVLFSCFVVAAMFGFAYWSRND